MSYLSERHFDFLTEIDTRYLKATFFAVIFSYTLLLVLEALGYSSDARLFPLVVGGPLLGLTALKLLQLLFEDRFRMDVTDLIDIGDMDAVADEENRDPALTYQRQFTMILWTAGVVALIWLFGHLIALAVFVFAFIYVYERSLRRAIVATALTYAFVHLLFIELLGASLWGGILVIGGAAIPLDVWLSVAGWGWLP